MLGAAVPASVERVPACSRWKSTSRQDPAGNLVDGEDNWLSTDTFAVTSGVKIGIFDALNQGEVKDTSAQVNAD